MKAVFLWCKDKRVCGGKRKCAATGLKMCHVSSKILHLHVTKLHEKLMEKAYHDSACMQ